MCLTQSYAQDGKPGQDTTRCYGITELRYIANTVVELQTCDTLLSVANTKLVNRDSLIKEKGVEISMLNKQLVLKDNIITEKDKEIKDLKDDVEKLGNHKRWLKAGWIATSTVFAILLVLQSVN